MLVSIALGTTAAPAAAPQSGLEAFGEPVSDAVLADQRGKFVASDGVRYFGLRLQTRWTDANGVTTAATLLFTLNFEGDAGDITNAIPMLLAGYVRDDGDSAALTGSSGEAIAAGSFDIGGGAVQSLQIAGSGNSVHNGMRIALMPADKVIAPDTSGLGALDGSSEVAFADGDRIQFLISPDELGLLMTGGVTDHSVQSFGGDAGHAVQDVYLGSDGNGLANDMSIVIGHDLGAGGQRISIQNSLLGLQGL